MTRTPAAGALPRAILQVAALCAVYAAIALAPVVLAAMQGLAGRPWHIELASGLAMAAFAMLLAEFVLAGRVGWLSRRLGMDVTMQAHRFAGIAALVLLALHPMLYGGAMYPEPQIWDPLRNRTAVLGTAALATGLLALLVLAALVFLAAFRAHLGFSYEAWRLSHVLGSLAVAGLGLHHTLATGRYAADPASVWFWSIATAVAAAAIAKVYVLDPLFGGLRRYRVAAVEPEAERTWRVRLEAPAGRPLRFEAGQFVWLKLGRAFARVREHPFSIASSPAAPGRIDLLVKEAGDFTRAVGGVAAGTPAFLDGPYGNFTLEGRAGDSVVLIAGGIGIAPMLSLLHGLAERGDRRPVTLVYGNRSEAQIAARAEFESLAQRLDLKVELVLSEPPPDWRGRTGTLDAATLAACLPEAQRAGALVFVCGPPAMIEAVELALEKLGVPLGQIVSERFVYQGGGATARERLLYATLAGVLAVIVAGALVFSLARPGGS